MHLHLEHVTGTLVYQPWHSGQYLHDKTPPGYQECLEFHCAVENEKDKNIILGTIKVKYIVNHSFIGTTFLQNITKASDNKLVCITV